MDKYLLYNKLVEICRDQKKIIQNPNILEESSKDLSFAEGKIPLYILYPSSVEEIEQIIIAANKLGFSIIPISTSSKVHYHGDTIPRKKNTIILNLSKMNRVLNIDVKNRVVMIEPGVTFGKLNSLLRKKGLRILSPLNPRDSKSVLASALEREPIIIPRYHWDSSDPLLCTEVIFGTGKLFRTGSAAGPGRLKEIRKSGRALVNPMGPTQFSPFRIIQGSQGSMGIVTWATIKVELIPSIQKVFHYQSDNIQDLLSLQKELLKYRLCDELFILNNLNLACILKNKSQEISKLSKGFKPWNLILVLSGMGKLANERIEYQEADIEDIIQELELKGLKKEIKIDDCFLKFINFPTSTPWRMRYKGCFKDIFFITKYERISEYISLVKLRFPEDLGVYIQPINQGTSYHCEFDIFHESNNKKLLETLKEKFMDVSINLMEKGAFFTRPYNLWAREMYSRYNPNVQVALKKVKKIFDPNNVLNPGVLCFDLE